MIKEIIIASALSLTPNTSIRRANMQNFGDSQAYLAEQFSQDLSNTYTIPLEFYTSSADYISSNVKVITSVDRTNQIFRYRVSYIDSDLNEFIFTNNYLIGVSEEIEDNYFYLSFEDYVEIDSKFEFYCNYGDLGITYDYASQNGDFISDMYTENDLMDIHFYLPNIFFNPFANFYLSLSYDTGGAEEIARLNAIIEELEIEISTLENAKRNLEEQNQSLSQENINLQNQIIVLNQYKSQLENEVNTLQNNYNEIYSLYENLLIENNNLIEENNRLQNQITELEKNQIVGNTFGSVIKIISDNARALLETEILPNFTIGNIIFIPVIFSLLGIIFKFFRR